MSEKCDAPQMQADALSELASVLALAGQVDRARDAVAQAIAIYRTKGDVVSTARAQSWAAKLA